MNLVFVIVLGKLCIWIWWQDRHAEVR